MSEVPATTAVSTTDLVNEAKKDWRDTFRGTVATKEVLFGAHMVERQYNRQFITFGRNSYFVSKLGRVLLKEEDVVVAEAEINKPISRVITNVTSSIERLKKLAENEGVTVGQKNKPSVVQVPLTSPIQYRFLTMLTLIDDEITLLESLWIYGVVPDKERTKREYDLKQEIRKVALAARNMFIRLRKLQKPGADGADGVKADGDSPKKAAGPKKQKAAAGDGKAEQGGATEAAPAAAAA